MFYLSSKRVNVLVILRTCKGIFVKALKKIEERAGLGRHSLAFAKCVRMHGDGRKIIQTDIKVLSVSRLILPVLLRGHFTDFLKGL